MDERSKYFYEFGPFRIDFAGRRLLQNGEPVPLTPKAYEILLVLVQNSEQLVEKDKLLSIVWPDTFVEEATLAQYVFTLRKVLGSRPEGGQYIQTVTKRGYRFAAPVREVWEPAPGATTRENPEASRAVEEEPAPAGEETLTSLAVLPLVNGSNDPDVEYLSDGLTETIINRLSQLPQLKVLARSIVFRYKGRTDDPQGIGRELGVRAVLVGRVLQYGDRLVIGTELVDVAKGWQMWGQRYDRKSADILAVQDEIAREISEQLHLSLTNQEKKVLSRHQTENTEAYRLYLKGHYHWNKHTAESYQQAIKFFEQAIKLDGNYALAYSGLADSYTLLDFYGIIPPGEMMPKALAAATRALLIDDTLAEAHSSLGCIKLIYERDWVGAEREFKRAIALNPHYAQAHSWYSLYLLAVGRTEESLAEGRLALELDPLDLNINVNLGWHYLYTDQIDLAIEQLEKTLEIDPGFHAARAFLGRAYEQAGRFTEAIAELEKAGREGNFTPALGFLGHAYAASGDREHARQVLDELEERFEKSYVPATSIGVIYAGLHDKATAFRWFRKSYEDRAEWLNWLRFIPELHALRPDPRYARLLRRLSVNG